jgi:hypothetical protein
MLSEMFTTARRDADKQQQKLKKKTARFLPLSLMPTVRLQSGLDPRGWGRFRHKQQYKLLPHKKLNKSFKKNVALRVRN